ncbi:putative Ntn-hydrolase superfamily protein [Xanthomonas sp. JAI131]|uniref:DUF1028 domain-containing protein n=1 Tax=Xanthomonas sp. JAI131 TaxID=2723067 RepID=UPI00180601D9|nr:DUF1028 domain-containing protein [Xanthomonas sp. JAI131]NYF19287.1 putative Ntn-hydrolase superfamily protein [Xanthomonas sp. JAI131]
MMCARVPLPAAMNVRIAACGEQRPRPRTFRKAFSCSRHREASDTMRFTRNLRQRAVRLIAVAFGFAIAGPALATFSIVACAPSGTCGAAVATNNLAVGATVIYAQANVGAVASQYETNPSYGPKGLALLQRHVSARAALDELVRTDDGFEGQDAAFRQVGIVGIGDEGAAFTGEQAMASPWSGSATGPGYAIQGNGLKSEAVIAAMRGAFLDGKGSLADRLLAALAAGQRAGGQTTGKMSAALLVRTQEGGFQDIDLRIDAAADPVPALRHLLDLHQANSAMVRAERAQRRGKREQARIALHEAIRLGADWDRVWRRAARLQMALGDSNGALQALAAFAHLNPTWAQLEMQDPLYTALPADQLPRIVSPAPD